MMKLEDLDQPTSCPGRFKLVQFRAGDLDPTDVDRIKLHLVACASCRAMLEDLDRRQAEFLEKFPVQEFIAGVKARMEQKRIQRRRLILRLVPAAAVLLILVAAGLFFLWPSHPVSGIRTKGGPPELGFFVQRRAY